MLHIISNPLTMVTHGNKKKTHHSKTFLNTTQQFQFYKINIIHFCTANISTIKLKNN